MFHTEAKLIQYFFYFTVFAAFAILFSSCAIKNAPIGKPFVYETNINIEGKHSTDEKKELTAQLEQQLHDSINPRRKGVLFFFPHLKKPSRF